MNPQEQSEFETLCKNCLGSNIDVLHFLTFQLAEQSKTQLLQFVDNVANFEKVAHIADNYSSQEVLFIFSELVLKSYLARVEHESPSIISNFNTFPIPWTYLIERHVRKQHKRINSMEYKMKIQILITLCGQLQKKGLEFPSFVINSICNCISKIYKATWSLMVDPKQTTLQLFGFLFSSSTPYQYIGLKILSYFLILVETDSKNYSFFMLKMFINDFQYKGITIFMEFTSKALNIALERLYQQGKSTPPHTVSQGGLVDCRVTNIEKQTLKMALKVFYQCLNFPLDFTYFALSTENEDEIHSSTPFPKSWGKLFLNFRLYDVMLNLIRLDNQVLDLEGQMTVSLKNQEAKSIVSNQLISVQ